MRNYTYRFVVGGNKPIGHATVAFQCQFQPVKVIPPTRLKWEDIVVCVPTKKGNQILYKGYTYVYKSRLQCGSEQWCCSYRQKTGCISVINMQASGIEVLRDFHNHTKPVFDDNDKVPEWVHIYYVKNYDKNYQCNLCQTEVIVSDDSGLELYNHIVDDHKEVLDLHKENTTPVGFRIEFLHLNVMKEDGTKADEDVIHEETFNEVVVPMEGTVLEEKKPKKRKMKSDSESRRRSWVWKYFHKLSNIIFRCNICNVVLSIKGCNTNNMNRHVKSRHLEIYLRETEDKYEPSDLLLDISEAEAPYAVKTEEITSKALNEPIVVDKSGRYKRSWIWNYFYRTSATTAECKLCRRNISHGGNATGNMNRHLKMIHNKTSDDTNWVWKVFDQEGENYTCKICQFNCDKTMDIKKSILSILEHLKYAHGVVSGEQIITGTDEVEEDEDAN